MAEVSMITVLDSGGTPREVATITALKALFPTTIGQKTAVGSLAVAIASDQVVKVAQQTNSFQSSMIITRPANTTAYTALDVVGLTANGVLNFPNIGIANEAILITGASLELDIAAIPSGMNSFRLHLYSASPASVIADNIAFDLQSGDRSTYLGYIDIDPPLRMGTTLYSQMTNINKPIKMPAGTTLYGYLQTLGAYTPANVSETYIAKINAIGY